MSQLVHIVRLNVKEVSVVLIVNMRLICLWCVVLAAAVRSQNLDYYAPQTFRQVRPALFQPMHRPWNIARTQDRAESYDAGLFTPANGNDVIPQGTNAAEWRPAGPSSGQEKWRGPDIPRPEPWRLPYGMSKEQQAAILHHKQSLSSEGAFRFEYASDNGLAAGEVIEPDGSRVGAYQYKDPSGQTVKLKYRAGKEGFQILEGSHLPKSPEPVPPQTQDNYYTQAYQQQRQQYELQQVYNQQRPEEQQRWTQTQPQGENKQDGGAGNQYFIQNWQQRGIEGQDDGQYHANEIDAQNRGGPHSFGQGYAFAFKG